MGYFCVFLLFGLGGVLGLVFFLFWLVVFL